MNRYTNAPLTAGIDPRIPTMLKTINGTLNINGTLIENINDANVLPLGVS